MLQIELNKNNNKGYQIVNLKGDTPENIPSNKCFTFDACIMWISLYTRDDEIWEIIPISHELVDISFNEGFIPYIPKEIK